MKGSSREKFDDSLLHFEGSKFLRDNKLDFQNLWKITEKRDKLNK